MSGITNPPGLLSSAAIASGVSAHDAALESGISIADIKARREADRLSDEDEPVIEPEGEEADVYDKLYSRPPSERTRQVFAETMRREMDGAIEAVAAELRDTPAPPPADPEAALIGALKAAAVQLRDAELALKAARENYGAKLQAFNRHVAPVVP